MKWILKESDITKNNIENIEQKLGLLLPNDFKQVIAHNNGASPEPNVYDTEITKEKIAGYLLSFNCNDQVNILDTYEALKDRLPKRFIPIMSDPFGNYICFDFLNENNPKVFFWNHENGTKEFIADNFTIFLNNLYAI